MTRFLTTCAQKNAILLANFFKSKYYFLACQVSTKLVKAIALVKSAQPKVKGQKISPRRKEKKLLKMKDVQYFFRMTVKVEVVLHTMTTKHKPPPFVHVVAACCRSNTSKNGKMCVHQRHYDINGYPFYQSMHNGISYQSGRLEQQSNKPS